MQIELCGSVDCIPLEASASAHARTVRRSRRTDMPPVLQIRGRIDWNTREQMKGRSCKIIDAVYKNDRRVRRESRYYRVAEHCFLVFLWMMNRAKVKELEGDGETNQIGSSNVARADYSRSPSLRSCCHALLLHGEIPLRVSRFYFATENCETLGLLWHGARRSQPIAPHG